MCNSWELKAVFKDQLKETSTHVQIQSNDKNLEGQIESKRVAVKCSKNKETHQIRCKFEPGIKKDSSWNDGDGKNICKCEIFM